MAAAPPTDRAAGDTIYALSSGRLPAAIAVVRISGPAAGRCLERLTGRRPTPRRAVVARLRDADGEVLDEALTLWFPGPASATGEDVAEVHLHGSIAVVESVFAALHGMGLRMADAGEFTRRALLNGRLDLTEVEGLADLLAAETETQRRDAMRRVEGHLGRRLRGWTDRIVALSAMVEASIDYDEDGDVADTRADVRAPLATLLHEIDDALRAPRATRLRDGVRVALIGPANAGKSSLLNRLVGSSAAIVSPRPGTTRDPVERPVAFDGIAFVLIDTAGLRDSGDDIEREGIERSLIAAERADIILDFGGSSPVDPRVVPISAKSDIHLASPATLAVSSVTGEGVSELIAILVRRARRLLPVAGETALDDRYYAGLKLTHDALLRVIDTDDDVLIAANLADARDALDRLTGHGDVEAVLDALFGRFCLGK